MLQRAVGQQRIGREGARRDLLLRFEHRGELFALLFEPVITFLGKWPRDMLHVIGIIDFIRADVTLGGHALVDAKADEGREHKRRAVQKQQLRASSL